MKIPRIFNIIPKTWTGVWGVIEKVFNVPFSRLLTTMKWRSSI